MILSLHMEFQDTEEQQPEKQEIAIYSKWAILLFSIFFMPLFGSILLMINLRSIGYKRQGTGVILFAILYQLLAGIIIRRITNLPLNITPNELLHNAQFIKFSIYSLVAQIIGGGILAEYFFKKYFPDDNYQYKSAWRPLAIIIIISLVISFLR
jgi:hypothetical protein